MTICGYKLKKNPAISYNGYRLGITGAAWVKNSKRGIHIVHAE